VTIIDRGETRYSGSMQGLLRSHDETPCFRLVLARALADPAAALGGAGVEVTALPGVAATGGIEYRVQFTGAVADTGPLLQAVLAAGGQVQRFEPLERQLDEAFLDLTDPGVRT
jgi:ABC-2 type transport system ATP-binding protein